MHAPDRGTQDNVHQLSADKLKQRDVIFIDIANDSVSVRAACYACANLIHLIQCHFCRITRQTRIRKSFNQKKLAADLWKAIGR